MIVDVLNAEVPLDWRHSKGHLGKLFAVIDSGSITSRKWLIKLAAGAKPIHVEFLVLCAAAATLALYEAPTSSADGSALTILPVNRAVQLPPPAGLTAFYGPTTSANGVLLDTNGNVASVPFMVPALAVEWILSPNTNYLLVETHAGTVQTTIVALLYEG